MQLLKIKFLSFVFIGLSIGLTFGQGNRCVIKVDGKYGYIDTLGKIVIQPQFEYAIQFSEGLASVKTKGKFGFIDTAGNFVIEPAFVGADGFKEGFARVWTNDKNGMINKNGKLVIAEKYDYVSTPNEGFCYVEKEEKVAFFDLKKQKFITKFIYEKEEVWDFNEGLAMVKIGKNYGFIDTKGKVAIPAIYRQVRMMQFSCGLASVRSTENGLWGYINKKGEQVIDFKYNEAYDFKENKAWVKEKYEVPGYMIDTNGNRIFEQSFDYVWGFKYGLCGVKVGKKHGIIDSLGNWLVEPKYDWIHVFYHNGWIAFYNFVDGQAKWGILNSKGVEIVPPTYENVVQNDGDCILPEVYIGSCRADTDQCARGYVNLNGQLVYAPTE